MDPCMDGLEGGHVHGKRERVHSKHEGVDSNPSWSNFLCGITKSLGQNKYHIYQQIQQHIDR